MSRGRLRNKLCAGSPLTSYSAARLPEPAVALAERCLTGQKGSPSRLPILPRFSDRPWAVNERARRGGAGGAVSIAAMNWAWQQQLSPTPKLILMALADAADDQGICWPSVATLASKVGVSTRTVRRVMQELISGELLSTEQRYRSDGSCSSNRYRLSLAGGDKLSPAPDASDTYSSRVGARNRVLGTRMPLQGNLLSGTSRLGIWHPNISFRTLTRTTGISFLASTLLVFR